MRLTVRTSLSRSVLLACSLGAGALGAAQAGCSSTNVSPGASSGVGVTSSADNLDSGKGTGTASITATWTLPGLPGEEQLTTLSWQVTLVADAGADVQDGTVAVSSDPTSFAISNLQPGSATVPTYKLSVSGTTTDLATICKGTTLFSVKANQTTNVSLTLPCGSAFPDAGYAQVNGTAFNCPTLGAVSVIPAEVTVGHDVAVSASATGPDPSSVTYAWSAPSGTFSSPTSASTSFTCTVAGVVPLTLQIGDGPLPDGSACDPAQSTTTVSVTCD
jgi:hypothetical protein